MKKITFILLNFIPAFLLAETDSGCIIEYQKYKTMTKQEITEFAKHCKKTAIDKNKYYISKIKTVNVTAPLNTAANNTVNNIYDRQKQSQKPFIKTKNISKPKELSVIDTLSKKPLTKILSYAINHHLTNKNIGKLIIKKAFKYRENLDYEYVKNVFSSNFTIKDLKMLKNALNKIEF